MRRFQHHHVLLFAITIAFACDALPTQASIELSLGSNAIADYPGPYGSLTLNLVDSNTINVTLTGNNVGIYHYYFGDGSTIALNLVGDGPFVVADPKPTNYFRTASGQVSEWGTFNFIMDLKGGFGNAIQCLSFTVMDAGLGCNWTSESNILTSNEDGYLAAGHVFVCVSPCIETITTGYATNAICTPEPISLLIWSLIGGLSIVIIWRRHS